MTSDARPRSRRAWAVHIVRTELRLLIGLTLALLLLWGFVHQAGEIREGDTYKLDSAILLALRRPGDLATPIGPRWLHETARDITALGGFTVLGLITVLSVVLLVMHRRRLQALIFGVAVLVGQFSAEGVKHLVGRTRPDLVPHLDQVYSASFPSGHSAMTPIVYLTLAGIVAAGEANRAAKSLLLAVAVGLVITVGVSRVYLGVHWPTDVLGGWALGSAVALMATLILHRLAPHHARGGSKPGESPVAPEPRAPADRSAS